MFKKSIFYSNEDGIFSLLNRNQHEILHFDRFFAEEPKGIRALVIKLLRFGIKFIAIFLFRALTVLMQFNIFLIGKGKAC